MRVRWIFAAAAFLVAAFPTAVQADDGWRVVDTAGVVRVGGPGFMPVALTRDQNLPADAWIETASGRAVLVRGQETVVVEPNSRIQLPSERVNGNVQVLQTLGSALYQIGKQKKPHFQVDTPYLAAVVKGTAFTITVGNDRASVAVTEGLVEVSTPDQEDVQYVRPGFTAFVSRDNGGEINLDKSRGNDKQNGPEEPKGKGRETTAVFIPNAIGDVDIDVKQVSNGLVSNDLLVADRLSKDVVLVSKDKDDTGDQDKHVKDGDVAIVPTVVDTAVDATVDAPIGVTEPGPVDVGPVVDEVDDIRGHGKGLLKKLGLD